MKQINERFKFDIGLVGQTINNTNATGRYYSLANVKRVFAFLIGGAAAATKTVKLELLQATDNAATGAKALTGDASATGTANTLATVVTVSLGSAAATDTVTINGILFTMALATDATAREFADDEGLATCVNHATYGVPGVSATAATDVATLIADPAGDAALTVVGANVAGTVTVATTQAAAFVEARAADFDMANGFDHVACKVTSTGNGIDAVMLVREMCYEPTQKVAASTALKAS